MNCKDLMCNSYSMTWFLDESSRFLNEIYGISTRQLEAHIALFIYVPPLHDKTINRLNNQPKCTHPFVFDPPALHMRHPLCCRTQGLDIDEDNWRCIFFVAIGPWASIKIFICSCSTFDQTRISSPMCLTLAYHVSWYTINHISQHSLVKLCKTCLYKLVLVH